MAREQALAPRMRFVSPCSGDETARAYKVPTATGASAHPRAQHIQRSVSAQISRPIALPRKQPAYIWSILVTLTDAVRRLCAIEMAVNDFALLQRRASFLIRPASMTDRARPERGQGLGLPQRRKPGRPGVVDRQAQRGTKRSAPLAARHARSPETARRSLASWEPDPGRHVNCSSKFRHLKCKE